MKENKKISDYLIENKYYNYINNEKNKMSNKNDLYLDHLFKPNIENLGDNKKNKDYNGKFDNLEWARAKEFFNGDYYLYNKIDSNDILQGQLNNSYFLSALSCIADYNNGNLIKRLFVDNKINKNSIYGVWLFIDGAWKMIIVDDYFPCFKNNGEPNFVFSKTDNNEIWVLLLEKAFAKYRNSYFNMIEGNNAESLTMLTGCPTLTIKVNYSENNFNEILKYFNKKNIITCSSNINKKNNEIRTNKLVEGNSYSILDIREIEIENGEKEKLLKIRNPWGNLEWNGDWSDKSDKWTNKLKKDLKLFTLNDGIFWICYKDFCLNFNYFYVCEIEENSLYNSIEYLEKNKTITKMIIEEDTLLELSINQFNKRNYDSNHLYGNYRITIILLENNSFTLIDSIFSSNKNIYLNLNLLKGNYYILINKYDNTSYKQSFNLSTRSNKIINLQNIENIDRYFDILEYNAWLNLKYDLEISDLIQNDNLIIHEINDERIKKANLKILNIKNKEIELQINLIAYIKQLEGYEIVNLHYNHKINIELVNEKSNIIILRTIPNNLISNLYNFEFEIQGDILGEENNINKNLINELNSILKIEEINIKYKKNKIENGCECKIY